MKTIDVDEFYEMYGNAMVSYAWEYRMDIIYRGILANGKEIKVGYNRYNRNETPLPPGHRYDPIAVSALAPEWGSIWDGRQIESFCDLSGDMKFPGDEK